MPRARNIKPGFFENEHLGALPGDIQLFFIGLWTQADREGVIELRISKIRKALFGFRPDITDEILKDYLTVIERLDNGTMLGRASMDGNDYIIINNFPEHQKPHHTEKKGKLPSRKSLLARGDAALTVMSPLGNGENASRNALITDLLITDLLIPERGKAPSQNFEDLKLEGEYLEFATSENLTGDAAIKSWKTFKIHFSKSPPADPLIAWGKWVLGEKRISVADAAPPAHTPHEKLIMRLAKANWMRSKPQLPQSAEEKKFLESWEKENHPVTWINLDQWKQKHGESP